MKSIVAMLLGALLCVQPVSAMQVKEPVLYTQRASHDASLLGTGGLGPIMNTQRAGEGTEKKESVQEETEVQEGTEAQGETDEAQEDEKEGAAAQGEISVQETEEAQEDAGGSESSGTSGQVEVSAPSAVLMESSTGQVIFEKDADTQRPPASVTKVMTLLLIFDALADGKIKLEDSVTTSEYAASMGGSQVFLEPGEVQTVDTLIKCISVASANDACVAFKYSRQILGHIRCTNEGKSAILYIEENG